MNWDKFFASPALIESARSRLSQRIVENGECFLWQGCKGSRGYGTLAVGKRNKESAHRLAWALANKSAPPAGMHVMHSCDTPACVNPAHLSIGTAADNQRDCSRKGRKNVARGSRHKSAKTTEGQMVRAAQLFAQGMTYRCISGRLGISRWSLIKTLQGHRWPHLQSTLRAILQSSKQMEAA
jgi:hypothetical protein